MHVIIDGDPLVYRAGFSAEVHSYDLVVADPEGGLHQLYFAPLAANGKDRKDPVTAGAQMKEWSKAHKDWTILSKDLVVTPEAKEHALQIAKTAITYTISAISKEYKLPLSQLSITLLLSGPCNFRGNLGTIRPYKGNREDIAKPHWYQAIRDYMVEFWDAKVIHGREADDECSILARNDLNDRRSYVIATIDKDLDQVPGLHYDYAKRVFYDIDKWEASQLFWVQVMAGDSTDNIQGMYRVGVKKAKDLLANFNKLYAKQVGDPFHNREQYEKVLWNHIVDLYDDNMTKYPDKFPEGMSEDEAALETARLVFMQEYEGQLWNPPGIVDDILEDIQ